MGGPIDSIGPSVTPGNRQRGDGGNSRLAHRAETTSDINQSPYRFEQHSNAGPALTATLVSDGDGGGGGQHVVQTPIRPTFAAFLMVINFVWSGGQLEVAARHNTNR